mmetsp:Transcript_18846/g.20978  ORF Transcript_18846/g.20978 Transcript_18846/m.20978 type:complete len:222 (-) Transcript_18846:224-889(-)
MVHGTTREAAWSIVKAGFGVLSSLDAGYYGQGIYFTRSIKYACSYDTSGKDNKKTLVLSLVTPGNVYPVTENPQDEANLVGKPIKAGYQSHYVLVNSKGQVLEQDKIDKAMYDELVVAQDVQTVARYIITVVRKPKQQTKRAKKSPATSQGIGESGSDDLSDSDDCDNFTSNRQLWASSYLNESQIQQPTTYDKLLQALEENKRLKQVHMRLMEINTRLNN